MKHRTQSTLANCIPVPARRQLGPVGAIILSVALAVAMLAILAIGFAPKAGASITRTGPQKAPTATVLICHLPGHLISVTYRGHEYRTHLRHRADRIEGRDGTAEQIVARCKPLPTR